MAAHVATCVRWSVQCAELESGSGAGSAAAGGVAQALPYSTLLLPPRPSPNDAHSPLSLPSLTFTTSHTQQQRVGGGRGRTHGARGRRAVAARGQPRPRLQGGVHLCRCGCVERPGKGV